MIEIESRIDELKAMGLDRRIRMVSGPQGPHVLLDGKPVLLLCSSNYLGLADHPRVRETAAAAAMRWGVGAGASRSESGTMTIHRRLEERLAAFQGRERVLLFGSGYLAHAGVIPALARPGDVIFSDERNHASITDGCRLARAEVFVYDHCDSEHLAWGIAQAEGRGALIVTEGVFALEGDLAPLSDFVHLARRHRMRVLVDDTHGIGALGPGGRGAAAALGLEDQVDLIVGSLGTALGSYGGFVACDRQMARHLAGTARTLMFSTAPPPPAVAGALAALGLLEEKPRLVERLEANTATLRAGLEREGFAIRGLPTQPTPIITLPVGDAALAARVCQAALERGVFAQAVIPPAVPAVSSAVRLSVMASQRRRELEAAARTFGQAARAAGFDPGARIAPISEALNRAPDEPALEARGVFDFDARAA